MTTPDARPPSRFFAALAACGAMAVAGGAWSRERDAPPAALPAASSAAASSGVSISSGVNDGAVLTGADATDSERLEAARRLVLRNDAQTMSLLRDALRGERDAPRVASALAIAGADPGSPRFSGALREGLQSASSLACVRAVLSAFDTYPARIACEAAIARLQRGDAPGEIADEIARSLRSWTGCDECSRSGMAGWAEWWDRVKDLDESAWNAELVVNFRARAERVERRREDIVARYLDLFGRLHSATPPEKRGELIASMLRDDLTRVNRLGLDLASRALLNAQPLGDEVATAASALLANEDDDIRAGAARLLENLGGAEHAGAVANALERERSARIAAPLLRLTARLSPDPAPRGAMLRWLSSEEPASSAAADALLACINAATLPADARQGALEALRLAPVDAYTTSHARLLGALATPADHARLVALMREHPTPGVRAAAAHALSSSPEAVDEVLASAAENPELFAAACEAVRAHRPQPEWFHALLAFAPASDTTATLLTGVIEVMSSDAREAALRAVPDLTMRDAMLVELLSRSVAHADPGERALHSLHAETRLDLGDARGALESAALAVTPDETPDERVARIRFLALVTLNRLDEARGAPGGDRAGLWIDALDRCAGMGHAGAIADRITREFASTMTPEETARFETAVGAVHGGPQGATPDNSRDSE